MTNTQWQSRLTQQNINNQKAPGGKGNANPALYQTRQSSLESIIRQVKNTSVQNSKIKSNISRPFTSNGNGYPHTKTTTKIAAKERLQQQQAYVPGGITTRKDGKSLAVDDRRGKVRFQEGPKELEEAEPQQEIVARLYDISPNFDTVLIIDLDVLLQRPF